MNKNYIQIDLENYSMINCNALFSQPGMVLVLKFAGDYQTGSNGNGDGLFMCAMTAAYCTMLEPASLVIDLSLLNYRWGNTILRTLNYFWEQGKDADEKQKQVVIVSRGETRESLETLEKQVNSGNRLYVDTLEQALLQAEIAANHYLA